MRGKAGGLLQVTEFPIQPYQYPAPDFLFKSTRYMDCVFQSFIYATLYGLLARIQHIHYIFNQATERGLFLQGTCSNLWWF